MRRTRHVLTAALAAATLFTFAPAASAHHTEAHTAARTCDDNVPPQNPESSKVLGWSYYTGQPAYGIRSGDVYLFVDGDASRGVRVAVFQPWWDDRGIIRGPAWVDASVTVGGAGGPVAVCNESVAPSLALPY